MEKENLKKLIEQGCSKLRTSPDKQFDLANILLEIVDHAGEGGGAGGGVCASTKDIYTIVSGIINLNGMHLTKAGAAFYLGISEDDVDKLLNGDFMRFKAKDYSIVVGNVCFSAGEDDDLSAGEEAAIAKGQKGGEKSPGILLSSAVMALLDDGSYASFSLYKFSVIPNRGEDSGSSQEKFVGGGDTGGGGGDEEINPFYVLTYSG